ncbi:HD domain-containing protein [bacterium]|nr:HD domain-containing protein [bacterium]
MEDIKAIEDFFHYVPNFSEDPVDILDSVIQKAKKYLSESDIQKIRDTYEFTKAAHAGVYRLSGEPYIIHPMKVAENLMEINPDLVSIQTAILHDVIEDTDFTYDDIKETFGLEIADLCEGLKKVSTVKYRGEERSLETLKKTFLAMAKDLRVIFIKLADRMHNIQTLQYHPKPEKRDRIANETLKVYAPVAKRLGLYTYQLYLENGAFKMLKPEKFEKIMDYLKKSF